MYSHLMHFLLVVYRDPSWFGFVGASGHVTTSTVTIFNLFCCKIILDPSN